MKAFANLIAVGLVSFLMMGCKASTTTKKPPSSDPDINVDVGETDSKLDVDVDAGGVNVDVNEDGVNVDVESK